jgi:hypothetical protein
MIRRQARLMPPMHRGKGGFLFRVKSPVSNKRRRQAILRKLAARAAELAKARYFVSN